MAEIQIGDIRTIADLDIFENDNITIIAEEDEVICSLQEVQEVKIPEDEEGSEAEASDIPTVDETEESEESQDA